MNISHLYPDFYNPLSVALANQTSEALIVLDKDYRIALFNKTAENIFNYPENKTIGVSFEEVCSLSKVKCFINQYKNLLEQKKSTSILSLIHKRKIKWHTQTIEADKHTFYMLKTIGLTEKENLNEIYKLETLIEYMPCNVYWVDKNCKMIWCNQNLLNILNMTREEFCGKTYEELSELGHWPEGIGAQFKNDDLTVLHTGIPIIAKEEPPIFHPDGSYSVYLTSRMPLRNHEGDIVGIAGISTEITNLKEATAKAEAANRAKIEFIANMSHDIRTPLSGVVGMSELLEEKTKDAEEKQYAQWINESGEQLLAMLNGILDVVSADNINESDIHEKNFDLYDCIQDIVKLELPTTKLKKLDLRVDIDETVPQYIISDRTKIHRILLNLLGNAIKFTEKGHVYIELKSLLNTDNETKIRFCVADTGIGIPHDAQDKVFDRFYRVSPSYKGIYTGHGVGLHIAQSYVKLLGGEIKLESQEGVGTTFYFDLSLKTGHPVAANPSDVPIPAYESITSWPQTPPYLLLIEDNSIARRMAEVFATKLGCPFISAIDGEQALTLAQSEPFDLIVTDFGLPGISGQEFTSRFRAWEKAMNKTPIPIIGLTAHSKDNAKKECLECGMNDIFSKPITISMLRKIIRQFVLSTDDSCFANQMQGTGKFEPNLPDCEELLFALQQFSLFDIYDAIKHLGTETMVLDVLQLMVNKEIPTEMAAFQKAYAEKNWAEIEKLSHKMKGGAVYCGTIRMKFACQYLERYLKAGHRQLLDKLYDQLLHVIQETKDHIEQYLKKENSLALKELMVD